MEKWGERLKFLMIIKISVKDPPLFFSFMVVLEMLRYSGA